MNKKGFKFFLLLLLGVFIFNFAAAQEFETSTGTTTEKKQEEEKQEEEFGLLGGETDEGCTAFLEEDFDSYEEGILDDQGSWTTNYNGNIINVAGSAAKAGAKGIWSDNGEETDEQIGKTGTAKAEGVIGFWFKIGNSGSTRDGYVVLKDGANLKGQLGYRNQKIQYEDDAGSWADLEDSPALDTWYYLETEYSASQDSGSFRYRIDGGDWTSWCNYRGSFSTLDTFDIYFDGRGDTEFYIDDIGCITEEEEEEETGTDIFGTWFSEAGYYILWTLAFVFAIILIKPIISIIKIIIYNQRNNRL